MYCRVQPDLAAGAGAAAVLHFASLQALGAAGAERLRVGWTQKFRLRPHFPEGVGQRIGVLIHR